MERQLCECSCGEYAKLNHRGKPNRYITGHNVSVKTKYTEQFKTPPLCKCPCKQPVKWNKDTNKWNTYIHGHNGQGVTKYPEKYDEPPLCKCGCGEFTKWCNQRYQWNEYVHGHNGRGIPRSQETKDKIGNWHRGKTVSKITRKKLSKARKGKKTQPCKQETKDKIRDRLKGRKCTQEHKDNTSKGITKKWQDPEYVEKVLKGHDEHWTEERRKEKSIATIERFEDPKEREKTSLGVKKYIKDNNISYKGENNPSYGRTLSKEHRAILLETLTGREVSGETRIKLSCTAQNITRDEWTHFISCDPYCQIWTEEFKEMIKERDNHTCQNPDCWKTSKRICGHHIDYNKKNCNPWNIITICLSCNTRANTDRDYWQKFYEDIMKENIIN